MAFNRNSTYLEGTGDPNADMKIKDGGVNLPKFYIDTNTDPVTLYKFDSSKPSGSKWVKVNNFDKSYVQSYLGANEGITFISGTFIKLKGASTVDNNKDFTVSAAGDKWTANFTETKLASINISFIIIPVGALVTSLQAGIFKNGALIQGSLIYITPDSSGICSTSFSTDTLMAQNDFIDARILGDPNNTQYTIQSLRTNILAI